VGHVKCLEKFRIENHDAQEKQEHAGQKRTVQNDRQKSALEPVREKSAQIGSVESKPGLDAEDPVHRSNGRNQIDSASSRRAHIKKTAEYPTQPESEKRHIEKNQTRHLTRATAGR